MSEEQPVQPHEQDDCEGCQKERAQNNQLINFYERLNKIKTKVTNIKPTLNTFTSSGKNNQSRLHNIGQRIKNPPNMDFSHFNQKQMGYELAYALIEREMKMKKENEILYKKIKDLKEKNDSFKLENTIKYEKQLKEKSKMKHKQKQQRQKEKQRQKITSSYDGYNDSLDSIKESKSSFWVQEMSPKTYQRRQKNNESKISNYSKSFTAKAQNSSTSSSFQLVGGKTNNKNEKEERKKIQGLNLWLYQMNAEEEEKGLYKTSGDKQKFN